MTGPGWGSAPPGPSEQQPSERPPAEWRPWSGGPAAGQWRGGQWSASPPPLPPPLWPSSPGQPYTGPPPTTRDGAPPLVPFGAPPRLPPGAYGAGPGVLPGARPAGRIRPTTPPGAPPYDVPQPYLLLMRARDWAWWRPVLGLLLFGVLYLVAVLVLVGVAAVTGAAPDLALDDLADPLVLLVTNASLVVAIPIIWLCWAVPHGLRIGWSSSVLGRLRWRLLWPYTLRALLTLGLAVGLTVVVTVLTSGVEITGPDSSFGWLLLVVLLTTPLQAAAEEYLFRGYLSQAIAGWIGGPRAGAVVAGVVTAVLFSLAHVPPDFLTFLDRFTIGLAFSAVVWLTGGLEAAIVLHAVNNVVIFLLVGLLGDEALSLDASSGSNALLDWGTVLLGILAMAAFVAWVASSRSRLHPEVLGPVLDLRGSPSWGPPPLAWSPPPPRWAPPPPDDRWARPAATNDTPGGPRAADQGGSPGTGPAPGT
jgi:membrane protease YdiL (CAAX protease family)